MWVRDDPLQLLPKPSEVVNPIMPRRWSDDLDDVISGDITPAAGYITAGGGAVVTAAASCGIGERDGQGRPSCPLCLCPLHHCAQGGASRTQVRRSAALPGQILA